MKALLRFVIVLGFVIMIGSAGGADAQRIGFLRLVLFELFGMALALFGYSVLCHYKRHLRRTVKTSRQKCKVSIAGKMTAPKKELC